MGIGFQQGDGIAERRMAPRSETRLDVSVRERGRSALTARIVSLSRLGCSISGYRIIAPGGPVWIKLPGLESQSGHVSWCHEFDAGISFDQPLHPAVLGRFTGENQGVTYFPAAEVVPGPSLPVAANDVLLTRREQIMQGIAESERTPLVQRKATSSMGLTGMINRRVARQINYRYETRYPDPVSMDEAMLTVEGQQARVLNASASGLRLAVELTAEIGDQVAVEFAGFDAYDGRLVWLRNGEAGISLPLNTIELCDNAA
jgi:hypothetical protein